MGTALIGVFLIEAFFASFILLYIMIIRFVRNKNSRKKNENYIKVLKVLRNGIDQGKFFPDKMKGIHNIHHSTVIRVVVAEANFLDKDELVLIEKLMREGGWIQSLVYSIVGGNREAQLYGIELIQVYYFPSVLGALKSMIPLMDEERKLLSLYTLVKIDDGLSVWSTSELLGSSLNHESRIVREIFFVLGRKDVKAMRRYLRRSSSATESVLALHALSAAQSEIAVQETLMFLEHPSLDVRTQAILTLTIIKAEIPRECILKALKDPAWQVRVRAVQYVSSCRSEFEKEICRALTDEHWWVRHRAKAAIDLAVEQQTGLEISAQRIAGTVKN